MKRVFGTPIYLKDMKNGIFNGRFNKRCFFDSTIDVSLLGQLAGSGALGN